MTVTINSLPFCGKDTVGRMVDIDVADVVVDVLEVKKMYRCYYYHCNNSHHYHHRDSNYLHPYYSSVLVVAVSSSFIIILI